MDRTRVLGWCFEVYIKVIPTLDHEAWGENDSGCIQSQHLEKDDTWGTPPKRSIP